MSLLPPRNSPCALSLKEQHSERWMWALPCVCPSRGDGSLTRLLFYSCAPMFHSKIRIKLQHRIHHIISVFPALLISLCTTMTYMNTQTELWPCWNLVFCPQFHFCSQTALFSSLHLYIILHPHSQPCKSTPLSPWLFLQLSPMLLCHTVQIKTPLYESRQCVWDWNQYPDLSLVAKYGHKKPAFSIWQQDGLSQVLFLKKGIPQSCLK